MRIRRGIGSFDLRGEAVRIVDHPDHVPIGLVSDAVIARPIQPGQRLSFSDVDLPDTLALKAWLEIRDRALGRISAPQSRT
jgi:predicted homoserine dehydrogenase-like protein